MKNILMLAFVALLNSSCTTHRFGDARIQNNRDLAGVISDRFYLKPVPIDRAATHTLQVRNLPLAMYPTHLLLRLTPTEAEMKRNVPWENARLSIEFRAMDGRAFFSKEIALSEGQRGLSPGTSHQLELQFRPAERRAWRAPENMARYTDYNVVVTVTEPSRNKNHRIELYADTYVR
jgi:hypothetical protein